MLTIRYYRSSDRNIWDNYVKNHPNGTLYHLSGWKNVIEETYGHKSYYLMALANSNNPSNPTNHNNRIVGILPLIHMKHFLFGNKLVSMPFFDMGGILADDEETEKALLTEAIQLGQKLKVKNIELRHTQPLTWLADSSKLKANSSNNSPISYGLSAMNCAFQTRSHKVRMLLPLPDSSEELWKSFKSKLRSQIRRPQKEGLKAQLGGPELLNDFYYVFTIN
ncbi:MAG TPA: peptidoglycan bridge formation glycyltransferase FemA/FemB family protein, partial [Candidatus Aerophobetes bacterium]|nr:peptidoglycan bridge formation glycyltransferase FemA/FemB family protein [Candidatus Aerophobetes bacterium]